MYKRQLDVHGDLLRAGKDTADGHLQLLSGTVADENIVLAADILHHSLVKLIAGNFDGGGLYHAAQGDNRHIGSCLLYTSTPSSQRLKGLPLEPGGLILRRINGCSELTCIGEHWSGAVAAVNGADNGVAYFEGKTFKPLAGWGAQFDYAAFVKGEDELAASLCAMAVVAFNGAKAYYEEKHDKATFVKNIISDNILLGDIYTQAKELHFLSEAPRAAFLVRQLGPADVTTIEVLQNLFPDKQTDFVISINETDVALIKQLPEGADAKELQKIAKQISAAVTKELGVQGDATLPQWPSICARC